VGSVGDASPEREPPELAHVAEGLGVIAVVCMAVMKELWTQYEPPDVRLIGHGWLLQLSFAFWYSLMVAVQLASCGEQLQLEQARVSENPSYTTSREPENSVGHS
jgi:hypothetical protein